MTRSRLRSPLLLGLILRPIAHEKIRTALTILGIAAGVAVLVAIQLSNQSALRAFRQSVDAIAGRANYQIVSDAGTIDERTLLALQPLWSERARFAPVIDADAFLQPNDTPIRVLGVDLLSDLHFRDYHYATIATQDTAAGREASAVRDMLALFAPDSVVVPEVLAREYGWKIGSGVKVRANGRDVTLIVRGILRPQGPATAFNGSLAIVDISVAQQLFGMRGQLSRIDLLLPEDNARAVELAKRAIPPNSRLERPSRRNERVGKMLRAFRVNLFALAAVALLVGVFLVYNTVLISILRRRRDVGIVKTLGASPRQIFFAFIGEGALFGVAGSVVGIALGYALAFGALDLIGRTINALYVESKPQAVTLTPLVIAIAIAVGTGVAIVAATQPALEAAAVTPASLIRPGLYQRMRRRRPLLLAFAAVISFAIAAVLSLLPPVEGMPLFGYASVVSVVAGVALLSPWALQSIAFALRNPLRGAFSMSGRIAASAVPASLRRTAVATAALAIAIGMMVAVAVMVGSFRETVRIWVNQTVSSDLWLRPARGLSNAPTATFGPEIAEAIDAIDFVAAYDRFRGHDMVYRDSIINVGSGDLEVSASHGRLPMITPDDPAIAMREAIRRGGVVISESLSLKQHLSVGDTLTLRTAEGEHAFPITGIYRDYSNDRGVAVMDRPLYSRLFHDDRINTVAIYLRHGITPDKAREQLERRLGGRFHLFAFTNVSIRREVMKIFDQTFLITYALLIVSLLVAVLGIVNTLSALILERRRELALLRVLGMSPAQIKLMIVLESSIIGAAATALGAATGYVLSWILIFVINKQSFGWTIELAPPYSLVAVSLLITFITTMIAGLFPARLANRLELSAELKGE